MHAALIVPAPFETVSGGYVYDRRIVDDLRVLGHTVDVVELAGRFPIPDETARAAARAAWRGLRPAAVPVIDGLALIGFAGLESELAARGAVGLIHHPLSMETGLNDEDREQLDARERALFRALRRCVVTSPTTAETLTGPFHVPEGRVISVIPGTDDRPRATGSGTSTCEILSIGTLIPRKGHDTLLRALARLFDLDWHLTIVGAADRDPPHAHGLVALAEDLNIAHRVAFMGEAVGPTLETLWAKADLFALATRYEGFGMVIAEALKHGIPVVVTKGGAAGTLVTPGSGCLCPVDDIDQLSKSLRRMIFGRALRAEMADAAWSAGQTLPSWRTQAELFAAAIA